MNSWKSGILELQSLPPNLFHMNFGVIQLDQIAEEPQAYFRSIPTK